MPWKYCSFIKSIALKSLNKYLFEQIDHIQLKFTCANFQIQCEEGLFVSLFLKNFRCNVVLRQFQEKIIEVSLSKKRNLARHSGEDTHLYT